jgi:hypothetical protein
MENGMKRWGWAFALLTGVSSPVVAQHGNVADPCTRVGSEAPAAARDWCIQTAQAVTSAQPQLGILLAAGNPLLGAGRAGGGFRIGILPQASVSAKLNLVLPDLRSAGSGAEPMAGRLNAVAPAISGTAMLGIFPGVSLAPMLAGIGSLDLLAQATYLPFRTLGTAGFEERSPELAYGAGVRVGILRESFLLPGVAVSAMYGRLGDAGFGNVCPGTAQTTSTNASQGYTLEQGSCTGSGDGRADGDAGEFSFNLDNISLRAIVSKRVLLLGLAAGVGYDRWESDISFGFRAPRDPRFFRASGLELSSRRWSAFANGVLSLPFVALAAEAGWLEGGAALAGFDPSRSGFDPRSGLWFGSLGVRLSL